MKRKHLKTCITQSNDATCIPNKRGMVKRAKRHSSKRGRQLLRKELLERIASIR